MWHWSHKIWSWKSFSCKKITFIAVLPCILIFGNDAEKFHGHFCSRPPLWGSQDMPQCVSLFDVLWVEMCILQFQKILFLEGFPPIFSVLSGILIKSSIWWMVIPERTGLIIFLLFVLIFFLFFFFFLERDFYLSALLWNCFKNAILILNSFCSLFNL